PGKHIYFASLPGMFERTVSCSSLSKTYSITGWRLGYIIASAKVIDAARKVHDFLTVGAAAPLQEAAVTALHFKDDYYTSLRDSYAQKRDLFLQGLARLGLPFTVPQGAYYVMADVSEFGVRSDLVFCEWLAQEVGVAAVPGSSFFRKDTNSFIRFHFAKKEETLTEALNRLDSMKSKAKGKKFD
ncbi:MAG: aminotransferase class I/II-fold pyridoxal phosphate-dependent enzyme, partial [Eubacteriales bacterium]